MLSEHTAAVRAICEESDIPTLPGMPSQVAELPCLYVGRPTLNTSENPAVFQVISDVWVIGRSVDDPDQFAEIERLTDSLLDVFGWDLITKANNLQVMVAAVEPATVTVGAQEFPANTVSIETAQIKRT